MNPERSFYNQPIRSLQTMLRTIALFSDDYERIVPDGIYGSETQAAISTFQRKHNLPVTGITDQRTWDEIVRMYDKALVSLEAPQAIDYELNSEFPYTRGDSGTRVKIAQHMLVQIAERYSCVCSPTISGSMDDVMINSISEFQRLNGLPINGKLDKPTWKYLVLQFVMTEMINNR